MQKFVVIFLLLAVACTSAEKESPAESSDSISVELPPSSQSDLVDSSTTDSATQVTPTAPRAVATFDARPMVVGDDTVLIVSLRTKNLIEVIDSVASFDAISSDDYAQYDIPEKALHAGGAWHEEAGEYFYVIEEGQDLVVYRAWLKEEQTTNTYPYKEINRFSLPQIEL